MQRREDAPSGLVGERLEGPVEVVRVGEVPLSVGGSVRPTVNRSGRDGVVGIPNSKRMSLEFQQYRPACAVGDARRSAEVSTPGGRASRRGSASAAPPSRAGRVGALGERLAHRDPTALRTSPPLPMTMAFWESRSTMISTRMSGPSHSVTRQVMAWGGSSGSWPAAARAPAPPPRAPRACR